MNSGPLSRKIRISGIKNLAIGLVSIAALNLLVFALTIINFEERLQVQYIPDDGYYYLTLARNFADLGNWTFDSGVSVTSGFHLLFGYIIAGVFYIFRPSPEGFVDIGILIGLLFTLAAIIVLTYWGLKEKNLLFICFLSLLIPTQNFIFNTISITEWPLVIFFASIYSVWFFVSIKKAQLKLGDFLFIFFIGFLLSLARSDSGLLPFSVFAAVLLLFVYKLVDREILSLAFAGLLGSIVGVLVGFGNNLIFTDELIQSSARMKSHWAQFSEPNFFSVPFILAGLIGIVGLSLIGILLAGAVIPSFFQKETKDIMVDSPRKLNNLEKQHLLIIVLSTFFCLGGYTVLYARNPGLQPWYTSNLILPILVLFFGLTMYISKRLSERFTIVVVLIFGVIVALNIINFHPLKNGRTPWPHQQFMYDAGIYIQQNQPDGRTGSWNAGIIGYYEGGHVVNLDGLVNNDIYSYVVRNDLQSYINDQEIVYLLDFNRMFEERYTQVRGGYEQAEFLESLEPVKVFSDDEFMWSFLTLYRLP